MFAHELPPLPLPMTIVSNLAGTFSGVKEEALIGLTLASLPGQRDTHKNPPRPIMRSAMSQVGTNGVTGINGDSIGDNTEGNMLSELLLVSSR